MSDDYYREARQGFRSKQPLYRRWEGTRRLAKDKGIPFQSSWRESYDAFVDDVGDPGDVAQYRLVLINPDRGYVWYNVRWVPLTRIKQTKELLWLSYRGHRDEACNWAAQFGVPLETFLRQLENGATLRQLDFLGRKLKKERAKAARRLAQAGVAVSNPNAG